MAVAVEAAGLTTDSVDASIKDLLCRLASPRAATSTPDEIAATLTSLGLGIKVTRVNMNGQLPPPDYSSELSRKALTLSFHLNNRPETERFYRELVNDAEECGKMALIMSIEETSVVTEYWRQLVNRYGFRAGDIMGQNLNTLIRGYVIALKMGNEDAAEGLRFLAELYPQGIYPMVITPDGELLAQTSATTL